MLKIFISPRSRVMCISISAVETSAGSSCPQLGVGLSLKPKATALLYFSELTESKQQ